MGEDYGATPQGGWAPLAPELLIENLVLSLGFWRDLLGFSIAYQRLAQGFAYLERPEGAQLMLCERAGRWETGLLEPPFGRGVMIQVTVAALAPVTLALEGANWPLYAGPREVWRRTGADREGGQLEIFVQDPDGYLVMVAERIGDRLPKLV